MSPALSKVLLLNPPSDRIYLRDLYHTFSAKAYYLWHPADMLILSGTLGRRFHITVRECIGEGMDVDGLTRSLEGHSRFDFIISLVGSLSLEGDMAALSRLKAAYPASRCLVIGDFVREKGAQLLAEQPLIDGCLQDFTTDNLVEVLEGWDSINAPQYNFILRIREKILDGGYQKLGTTFQAGVPHHEKFPLSRYRQPLNRKLPVGTVLGMVGCPFQCGFCAQSSVDVRQRPAQEVFAELVFLKHLGAREIWFRDQLMGASRRYLTTLCQLMIENRLGLTWYCSLRADSVTEELAALIAKAGCHSVLMGIETSNNTVLSELKTDKADALTERSVGLLRHAGVAVHGHFILGLPGETEDSILNTIRWAQNLDIDLASFALPSPDYGTSLRQKAIERKLIDDTRIVNTDRSKEAINLNDVVPASRLRELMRTANRNYYLRPKVFLRFGLLILRNPKLTGTIVRNFLVMARRFFLPGRA
jgi:tRNA A37 methylthiotransferase MiaB